MKEGCRRFRTVTKALQSMRTVAWEKRKIQISKQPCAQTKRKEVRRSPTGNDVHDCHGGGVADQYLPKSVLLILTLRSEEEVDVEGRFSLNF